MGSSGWQNAPDVEKEVFLEMTACDNNTDDDYKEWHRWIIRITLVYCKRLIDELLKLTLISENIVHRTCRIYNGDVQLTTLMNSHDARAKLIRVRK